MRPQSKASLSLVFVAALAACTTQPRVPTEADVNFEGLQSGNSQRFEIAQFRPGVDFTHYTAVQILEPDLEFRRPDRTQQEFPLTAEQRARFRDLLAASFRDAFATSETLTVVSHSGPDVLSLDVRVIDIVARVPPTGSGVGSRGTIALDATGQVTLVLEIRDSESGQMLARGVETRQVRGAAMRQNAEMLTQWTDVDALADRWADAARSGLEDLVAFSGT
jgi:hypothetical protein